MLKEYKLKKKKKHFMKKLHWKIERMSEEKNRTKENVIKKVTLM